jgi:hypothetical protein
MVVRCGGAGSTGKRQRQLGSAAGRGRAAKRVNSGGEGYSQVGWKLGGGWPAQCEKRRTSNGQQTSLRLPAKATKRASLHVKWMRRPRPDNATRPTSTLP